MRTLVVLAALMLAGCVSTEMRRYVGQTISEVQMAYGAPEQVIDLPGGNRAYQFRTGKGAVIIPGSANTSAVTTGSVTTAHTTLSPGGVVPTDGCLLTFIVDQSGRVTDFRVPKGLVC